MIKPFGNQILIEPHKKESIIQDENSLLEYGTVVEIGDKVEVIKKGDVIAFLIWGVNKIEIDNKTYYFINEDDKFILGNVYE